MTTKRWIVLALAACAVPALAQDSAPEGRGMTHEQAREATATLKPFDALDRNADGYLQWEEIRNEMTRLFHQTDADDNGFLGQSEIVFSQRLHDLADRNKDGVVDLRELMAETAAVFHLADTDDDGKISREEATAAKEKEGIQ